jgi:hypothetical protein
MTKEDSFGAVMALIFCGTVIILMISCLFYDYEKTRLQLQSEQPVPITDCKD